MFTGLGKVCVLWALGLGSRDLLQLRGDLVSPLPLSLFFSPYMALKVFEGGFSQPPSWRNQEHHGRGVSAHSQVPWEMDPISLSTRAGSHGLSW